MSLKPPSLPSRREEGFKEKNPLCPFKIPLFRGYRPFDINKYVKNILTYMGENYFITPCKFEKWLLESGPAEYIQPFIDKMGAEDQEILLMIVSNVSEEFRDPLEFPNPGVFEPNLLDRLGSIDIYDADGDIHSGDDWFYGVFTENYGGPVWDSLCRHNIVPNMDSTEDS